MRKFLIAITILGVLALLLWLGQQRGGQALGVDVAAVERGALADTALASGSLVYAEQIQLRSEVTGRVAEVLVEEGQQVRRGDLLMRLDQEAFQADLDAADAGVRAARIEIQSRQARQRDLARQLARQRSLQERGLIGLDAFEQLASEHEIASIAVQAAQQALLQAQAQRDLASDRLQRSLFIAPIDGLLVSVDVKPGETVIAGTVNIVGSDLMVLADPSVLLAELRVDEADIARVQLEQSVEVYAAAHPQTALHGKVVHIGTSARQLGASQSLAFRVRVQLDPSDLTLHPGMSCRAEIETAQGEPGLHVPVAALRRDEQGAYVWRVDAQQQAERVGVEAGMANDFAQEVVGELAEGDQIVVGPGRVLAQMDAGAALRIRDAQQ
jgi:HlyD family secretion protein